MSEYEIVKNTIHHCDELQRIMDEIKKMVAFSLDHPNSIIEIKIVNPELEWSDEVSIQNNMHHLVLPAILHSFTLQKKADVRELKSYLKERLDE
jgi:hypothetical protein